MTSSRPGIRVQDYQSAYQDGGLRPSEVCSATLEAVAASDRGQPPLRSVVKTLGDRAAAEAEASDKRWKASRPLSPFDGVPFVVKDNTDVAGVPTSNGSVFELPVPAADAWVVERMREAGAIMVGKANLHEMGAGTTGINPHHGTPRNPHDLSRWCGGSSSGSAAAVAAGLVPMAIGSDAGGSIRAPAAFVGAVGLKPTFGRVGRKGMSVLCDTMDHLGPIASDVMGATVALECMAGIAADDEETWDQLPLNGTGDAWAVVDQPAVGLRIGVARHLFDHERVDGRIATCVEQAADALRQAGATVSEVQVPDVDTSLLVGLVLIAAEGPAGLEDVLSRNRRRLGRDLRILLATGDELLARDYLKAQRVRKTIARAWSVIMGKIDLVLMPSAGRVAGRIRSDALATGELDEDGSARSISCTMPSNLTGYPAVSVPCGWVDDLPVGAQLVAKPWRELDALRAARAIERAQLFAWRQPAAYFGDQILA